VEIDKRRFGRFYIHDRIDFRCFVELAPGSARTPNGAASALTVTAINKFRNVITR